MKSMCTTFQSLSLPLWQAKLEGSYVVNDGTGCWDWTGKVDRYGYGQMIAWFGKRCRGTGAHRVAWIVHRGVIAPGLTIDHLCRNKICVNPNHMETVSNGENVRRANKHPGGKRGRKPIPLEARSGCGRHGLIDGQWAINTPGYTYWRCRICGRESQARHKERKQQVT